MIQIEKNNYARIYSWYLKNKFFFPLIASVLLDEQDGVVYVNNLNNPSQAYVEHVFGFAQIFGETDKQFEQEIEKYLFVNKSFKPVKIRLYAPNAPLFITKPEYQSLSTYRQRFIISPEIYKEEQAEFMADTRISVVPVNEGNVKNIEKKFNLVSRFWRNSFDFTRKSNAVVVTYNEEVASICYSAAEANSCLEIDVLTLPEYRNLGLAKQAVISFVTNSFALSLNPLWDCFTNNAGSMMLCKSVGFVALNEPYLFFTINK